MKKWDAAYFDAAGIVDWKEFNKGLSAFKSALNGGVDRSMLPEGFLEAEEIVDNALLQGLVFQRPDMNVKVDASTGGVGYFRGLSYATYGGSWELVDEFEIDNVKACLLHWEYSCHYFLDMYYSPSNPKRIQIKMLVDNVSVAEITPISNQIGTIRRFADVPLSGGRHKLSILARSVAPSSLENAECAWHLTGQQHLVIGRYR